LICSARSLYAEESFGVQLEQTVYALDCTTIDLCLSLFPWARYRSQNAAVKMHTLLDLHGNIPALSFELARTSTSSDSVPTWLTDPPDCVVIKAFV